MTLYFVRKKKKTKSLNGFELLEEWGVGKGEPITFGDKNKDSLISLS